MKLTMEQRERLSSLGRSMVAVCEQYKKDDFTFDAAIRSLHGMTALIRELMSFIQPFSDNLYAASIELSHTSKLHLFKRRKIRKHIDELKDIIHVISSTFIPPEVRSQIEAVFKASPVRSIHVHENHRETQLIRGFGLFEPPVESHIYNYTVNFADGTELEWHTLQFGAELDRVRNEYNQHIPRAVEAPAARAAAL